MLESPAHEDFDELPLLHVGRPDRQVRFSTLTAVGILRCLRKKSPNLERSGSELHGWNSLFSMDQHTYENNVHLMQSYVPIFWSVPIFLQQCTSTKANTGSPTWSFALFSTSSSFSIGCSATSSSLSSSVLPFRRCLYTKQAQLFRRTWLVGYWNLQAVFQQKFVPLIKSEIGFLDTIVNGFRKIKTIYVQNVEIDKNIFVCTSKCSVQASKQIWK